MTLSATGQSLPFLQYLDFNIHRRRGIRPLILLLAVALSACSEKPPQQAAAAAPPVTVAPPVKPTVTDWDEFTGRFEAVEEVHVRARVGGFVTSVEVRRGGIGRTRAATSYT